MSPVDPMYALSAPGRRLLDRRRFLSTASHALGSIAFASLLDRQRLLARDVASGSGAFATSAS